ncbi:MAG TPA: lysylphosphatidylglycerol synthase transmembrane domain-containing protein [Kofleriaceae bacterium]|nr:lysylphosphatidylglycerol synthase transmembrane domain-containing protein [Kofleriaceae bacterium]
MNPRLLLAIRLVVIAAVAAGLWFFVRELDWDTLGRALANAKLWPIAIAAVLNFAILFGKALSWRIMFAPNYVVSLLRLYRYTIAAFAASAIAPARAGELVRVLALKRRDGVPASATVAVALAEKLLDALSMLILVAPIPWLLPGLSGWVTNTISLAAVGTIGLLVGFWFAVGRVNPHKQGLLRRLIAGMHVLRDARRLAGSFVVLTLVWFCDLGMILLSLHAVGIELSVSGGILILFTLNLAIVVPSTPAAVGALQLGALAALDQLHVAHEPALAFALVYHALQVVPLLVVGLILELRLVLGRVPHHNHDRATTPVPTEDSTVDSTAR